MMAPQEGTNLDFFDYRTWCKYACEDRTRFFKLLNRFRLTVLLSRLQLTHLSLEEATFSKLLTVYPAKCLTLHTFMFDRLK